MGSVRGLQLILSPSTSISLPSCLPGDAGSHIRQEDSSLAVPAAPTVVQSQVPVINSLFHMHPRTLLRGASPGWYASCRVYQLHGLIENPEWKMERRHPEAVGFCTLCENWSEQRKETGHRCRVSASCRPREQHSDSGTSRQGQACAAPTWTTLGGHSEDPDPASSLPPSWFLSLLSLLLSLSPNPIKQREERTVGDYAKALTLSVCASPSFSLRS